MQGILFLMFRLGLLTDRMLMRKGLTSLGQIIKPNSIEGHNILLVIFIICRK